MWKPPCRLAPEGRKNVARWRKPLDPTGRKNVARGASPWTPAPGPWCDHRPNPDPPPSPPAHRPKNHPPQITTNLRHHPPRRPRRTPSLPQSPTPNPQAFPRLAGPPDHLTTSSPSAPGFSPCPLHPFQIIYTSKAEMRHGPPASGSVRNAATTWKNGSDDRSGPAGKPEPSVHTCGSPANVASALRCRI